MSDLIPHVFNDTTVRAIDRDGKIWFIAADVCKALEIGNVTKALYSLDEDEKATLTISKGQSQKYLDDKKTTLANSYNRAGQGAQSYNLINESGLYSLILRSRKPEAKRFKKWVTSEVLPSIRKTGGYSFRGNYNFPLETASPRKRVLANAWLTPRVILNQRNRAPELELLEALEKDGFDITGAKVRIYALHDIAQQLINVQSQLIDARKYLSLADQIIKAQLDERGNNIDFSRYDKGIAINKDDEQYIEKSY
ncbi:BRO family protein [Neisseriaceae bacterium ESL0693]|nr:BRO family protein [Neisseriaceae bacterium ESL0693]